MYCILKEILSIGAGAGEEVDVRGVHEVVVKTKVTGLGVGLQEKSAQDRLLF